jgi:hypothetical protein
MFLSLMADVRNDRRQRFADPLHLRRRYERFQHLDEARFLADVTLDEPKDVGVRADS